MWPTSLIAVLVWLTLSATLGADENKVASGIDERKEEKWRFRDSPRIENVTETLRVSLDNSSRLIEEKDKPRGKRALGVILQGLAEAFGYTVSPITIAVLPNPNATAATAAAAPPTVFTFPGIATPAPAGRPGRPNPQGQPGQRPQKPLPPTTTTTMSPRQKETLRFTGIVNFGNNSNLLGHLRRYEQIFHGAATTTTLRPPATSGPRKLGLLPPFFVKIPLPIAPNLPAPLLPPSPPRKLKQMSYKESYESGEITDEKEVRTRPPQGYRDTYIDEPEWLKQQRQENAKFHNHDESSEENEQRPPNKYKQGSRNKEPEASDEEPEDSRENEQLNDSGEESTPRKKEREEFEEQSHEEDSRQVPETENSPPGKLTKQESEESDEELEDDEEENERYSVNANNQALATLKKNNLSSLEDSFDFPKKPIVPKIFGSGLPIRVLDVPFPGSPGVFRDSYGQSLENNDGRTDQSLADYFERFKHPQTGIYRSDKVPNVGAPQRRDPWWLERPELPGEPLERIRQEYSPRPTRKYEEYKLRDDETKKPQVPSRRSAPRKKNRQEIATEEEAIAEPTMTTFARAKAPKSMKKRRVESNDVKKPSKPRRRTAQTSVTKKINKIKRNGDANTSASKNDVPARYNPYYKPLQIAYEPEKLERTAARILSYHNFEANGKSVKSGKYDEQQAADDKEGSAEREDEKPERKVAARPEGPETYVDEPESREKTSRPAKQRAGAVGEDVRDEEENESGERDSPESLKDEEPEVRGSPERLRENEESVEPNSSEDLKERDREDSKWKAEEESLEYLRESSHENEPEVEDDAPESWRGAAERENSSEHSEEAYRQEPEGRRPPEGSGERTNYQEPEDPGSMESPRRDRPGVHRDDRESQRSRHADEESRENGSGDESENDRFSEKLRENDEEPGANRFSEEISRESAERPGVGLPERLTGKRLHEGESKVVRAWPAPFDYTFDSTESTETLRSPNYSAIAYEKIEPTHVAPAIYKQYYVRTPGNGYSTNASPILGTRSIVELRPPNEPGTYYRDSAVAPTLESSTWLVPAYHETPKNRHNLENPPPNVTVYYKNPEPNSESYFGLESAFPQIQYPAVTYHTFLENESNIRRSSDEPNVYESEEPRELSIERKYETSDAPQASERRADAPTTFDGPESAHEFFQLSPDNYELNGQKFGQREPDKSTQSPNPTPSSPTNAQTLIQLLPDKQDDPNYRIDVNLTEFTDKPESETEKVRLKEYRNKVATIKVSENKKSTPDGDDHLVDFTRNF